MSLRAFLGPTALPRACGDADTSVLRWVNQRKAFGRPLHSLAVIRHKLAAMISRCESVQSWLENVTYQMCNMVSPLALPSLPRFRLLLS